LSINFKIAKNLQIPLFSWDSLSQFELQNIFDNSSAILDAIFGIGLNRALSDKYVSIIKFINSLKTSPQSVKNKKIIFSIDIPSGLDADTGEIYREAILADYTLSFTAPKKCFTLKTCQKYYGTVKIFDIGIPKKFEQLFLQVKNK
ncbi:MAG: NAD(P)H-hydrate epimerase, partial [Planctomycetota bacterium]